MTKLDVRAFGMLLGCIWGLGVLVVGVMAKMSGRGSRFVKLCSTVYRGYKPTWPGSLIGGLWGFLDGAVSGIVIAWLFNRFIAS